MMITMKTQILDSIFIKYGLKAIDLTRSVKEFDLDNDPDVESIKKANSQIKNNIINAQQKAHDEMNQELNNLFDEEFKKKYEAAVAGIEIGRAHV